MLSLNDLAAKLKEIDGRGYKAYKDILISFKGILLHPQAESGCEFPCPKPDYLPFYIKNGGKQHWKTY
jgi:hypothetical protein